MPKIIVTAAELTSPKTVTLAQLRRVLLPYCMGWRWAEDAINDLWLKGCPMPYCGPGVEEVRILLPGQFRKWWAEVQQRIGYEVAAEVMYVEAIH